MFRENARKLGIFGYEYLIFFYQKCFLVEINLLNEKKIEKKDLSKKVDGSSWIHPYLLVCDYHLMQQIESFVKKKELFFSYKYFQKKILLSYQNHHHHQNTLVQLMNLFNHSIDHQHELHMETIFLLLVSYSEKTCTYLN
jgi:hypothetical protein